MDALTSFKASYAAHVGKTSDKWSSYLQVYDDVLHSYRARPIRLLEIGIQNGGSLEIFSRYFTHAQCLIGCDINERCRALAFDDPRISVIVGDANHDSIHDEITARSDRFDIVIDDGSHQSGDIVRSFVRYFPRLEAGGVYIAEDLHCSYWMAYDGGLHDPTSSIAFFKCLADIVNHEHWGLAHSRTDLLTRFIQKYDLTIDETALASIGSVSFSNSMCVIRKVFPPENILGPRVVTGSDAVVDPTPIAAHGHAMAAADQTGNPLSQVAAQGEAELDRMRDTIRQQRRQLDTHASQHVIDVEQIARLQRLESAQCAHIDALMTSRSWRITAPLRRLGNLLKQ